MGSIWGAFLLIWGVFHYTYYLFNNQKKHAVINLDKKDRYLLSLYFQEEASYQILQRKLRSTITNK